MQLPTKHLLALCAVLAFGPSLSTVGAAIQPEWHDQQEYHRGRSGGFVFPFLRRLRDGAIETILGRPAAGGRARVTWADAEAVHDRFHGDIVVRFNVTNSEEEAALSKAAAQMLLDVWSFTPEYVDIRIYQRDVKSLLKLLPSSLEPAILIQDVAAAVWATYPSQSIRAPSFGAGPSQAENLVMDGPDNIFFSDYQPLVVSCSLSRACGRAPSSLRSLRL